MYLKPPKSICWKVLVDEMFGPHYSLTLVQNGLRGLPWLWKIRGLLLALRLSPSEDGRRAHQVLWTRLQTAQSDFFATWTVWAFQGVFSYLCVNLQCGGCFSSLLSTLIFLLLWIVWVISWWFRCCFNFAEVILARILVNFWMHTNEWGNVLCSREGWAFYTTCGYRYWWGTI